MAYGSLDTVTTIANCCNVSDGICADITSDDELIDKDPTCGTTTSVSRMKRNLHVHSSGAVCSNSDSLSIKTTAQPVTTTNAASTTTSFTSVSRVQRLCVHSLGAVCSNTDSLSIKTTAQPPPTTTKASATKASKSSKSSRKSKSMSKAR